MAIITDISNKRKIIEERRETRQQENAELIELRKQTKLLKRVCIGLVVALVIIPYAVTFLVLN